MTNAEMFAEWAAAELGDLREEAPADKEETSGFPVIPDGGEPAMLPEPYTAKEQFTDWMETFYPYRG